MRGCTACRKHQGRASKSRSGWRVTILGKAARQRATRRCLSVRNGGDTAEDGKPWDQSLPTVVRKAGTGLMLGRPPADFVAANPTPGQMLRLGPDAKGRLRRALTFKARNDHRLPPQGRGDRSSYAFTQGLTTEQNLSTRSVVMKKQIGAFENRPAVARKFSGYGECPKCLWCGQAFQRRSCGGSYQVFCTGKHRADFHKAARVWAESQLALGNLSIETLREVQPSVYAARGGVKLAQTIGSRFAMAELVGFQPGSTD